MKAYYTPREPRMRLEKAPSRQHEGILRFEAPKCAEFLLRFAKTLQKSNVAVKEVMNSIR